MKAESSVTCELRLRLLVAGDAALPVPAALRYDLADPYAIHATFHAAGDTVEWVFARDLLAAGLRDDAGLGDVRVWPSSEAGVQVVYISLSSPEGEALLEAPAPGSPADAYRAVGQGGNIIFISPSHDLVVVWRWSAQSAEGFRRVVAAITS